MKAYHTDKTISNLLFNSGFYNHLEAKIHAGTYYNIGYNLYKSILFSLRNSNCKTEDTWKLWPAFVNLAFSCEIILKLFYESDNGNMARGHKLYKDLFENLSDNSKRTIIEMTIIMMKEKGFKNYNKSDFLDDLKKCENTFAYERYVFEMIPGRNHNLQCGFLLSFSSVLNNLSKKLYNV